MTDPFEHREFAIVPQKDGDGFRCKIRRQDNRHFIMDRAVVRICWTLTFNSEDEAIAAAKQLADSAAL